MKVLILGGLSFLGRHLVEEGLRRGEEITVFTRGLTNPDAYPDIEKLRGDRDGDLSALKGRRWDVVVDTSGYVPRLVRDSARLLAGAVEHYSFISSISVYAAVDTPGMDEDAPVATLEDPSVEEITGGTYGGLKALCEEAVKEEVPDGVLIVRPGLIAGRYDPTDRFTYWPHRVAAGGEVLAPGEPADPVQIIDARDLASWVLDCAARRLTGTFNATGPSQPLTIGDVVSVSKDVSGSDASFTWVPATFLELHEVQPWIDMPAWIPDTDEYRGFSRVDVSRALAAGLTFRPLAATVRDTLDWAATFPPDHEWRAGLSKERERAVLDAWHASSSVPSDEPGT